MRDGLGGAWESQDCVRLIGSMRIRDTIWRVFLVASLCGLVSAAGFAAQAEAQSAASVPQARGSQTSSASSSDLDALIKNFDYTELGGAVATMPESAERDYFAGVLANRSGNLVESIELLTKVLPDLKVSRPDRASVALEALADDYTKSFRYAEAIPAFEDLLQKFATGMDPIERKSAQDDYQVALLLKDAPAQTISFDGAIDLATDRSPQIGTIETNLRVNGVEQAWIMDTGANISTVSASFAAKLGLKLSNGAAQTTGITGAENKLQIAILPEMKLGGATIRNVVLMVLDDDSLNVPVGNKEKYQINAILGYPVLAALGRFTFTKDGHFLAGPDSPSGQGGARLYMDELTPLLECEVENRKALFSFDTGADDSVLSDRFQHDFPDAFKGVRKKKYGLAGAGGAMQMKAYYLPEVQLEVGTAQAVLHKVPVLPAMGTDMDLRYGNLGRDLVDPYQSFTIDFENMRFLLGDKLATNSK
jgi:predicted aspartyl protease